MASPLGGDKDGLVNLPKQGTTNVLDAIERNGQNVKDVVVTSSIAAISSNAGLLPADHVYSEKDWSPAERLQEMERWYSLGKTLAEKAAWEHAIVKEKKVRLCTVNPGFVIGELTNARHQSGTPSRWVKMMCGEADEIPGSQSVMVDVYDIARVHVACFENKDANGRHACVSRTVDYTEMVAVLKKAFPQFPLPEKVSEKKGKGDQWDCSKSEKLIGGWSSLQDTMTRMGQSVIDLGLFKN